jgi:hypothetical protein
MDIDAIVFLFLVAAIGLAILAIPYIALYIFYKWLARKGFKIVGVSVIVAFSCFLAYNIYTGIYPTDDFYFSEFKQVTLRDAPKSASILSKNASYPDFHGGYCSASSMTLSAEDYAKLLRELNLDHRLTKTNFTEIVGSSELDKVITYKKMNQIAHGFVRNISGEEDHYLYIGFLNDQKTIVVSVCVT